MAAVVRELRESAQTVEEEPERARDPNPLQEGLRRAHSGPGGGSGEREGRTYMKEYRPGDWVEAEMKVKHLQVFRNVAVTYRNADDPDSEPIVLQFTGIKDSELDTDEGTKGPFSYVSTVELSGMVGTPAQNTPGVYELTEIDIEPFAGVTFPIHISTDDERRSPSYQPSARAFRVVEEPKGAPFVLSLNIE